MPGKKMKRGAKRKVKSTNNAISNFIKVEKEFLQIPGKLAAQLNKEVSAQKQKQNQLKASLNQTAVQIKAAEKAGNGKKLTAAAQKKYSKAVQLQKALQKEWEEASKAYAAISLRQAKFVALRKHLSQFEKDWSKQAKANKAAAKTPAKVSKKARKKPVFNESFTQQATKKVESFEPTLDNVSLDETTEEVIS